jgi:hypothetical protein
MVVVGIDPHKYSHTAVAADDNGRERDYVFRGTVDVASIRIWLRDPVP